MQVVHYEISMNDTTDGQTAVFNVTSYVTIIYSYLVFSQTTYVELGFQSYIEQLPS